MQANDIARARSALAAIPADVCRKDWIKAGQAAYAAGLQFDDFNEWSATGTKYKPGEIKATWRSFKFGDVGAGSLFYLAREHGWNESPQGNPKVDFSALLKQSPKAATKPQEPPKAPPPRPGMGASEVWNRCEPADYSHPYIVSKKAAGVPLGDLRVVPAGDSLHIAGQAMDGSLAVPAFAPDGTIQTIQFIPAPGAGKKLNLPGANVSGAWHTVGELVPGGVVHVVEGIGQAWACWQATGHPAVVCFGAGNMGKVAAALRQGDESAKLVLVPDVGKEDDAAKIAAEVGAAVAAMPPGKPSNYDASDYAQEYGVTELERLLEDATEPPKPAPKVHPLARFVDIDGTAKPPRWVIPGFIGHGVTVIAGAHGVGKTTALLPLALTAAGLHGDELMPRQWRHVVYVTEDVEQARRILAGIVLHSNLGINLESVRERVHIVEAVRLDPAFVAQVGTTYREQFTRTVEGVEVLPLVVLDTKSAVLALDNENDNAEASSMMAALKQGFDGLPIWLIGHVAKANLTRNDALTSRGASAIEGDANQTMFLIREGESRYLLQGKARFESRWPELEIISNTAQTVEPDEFGNLETVILRWGIAAPAQQSRKEAAEQAAEQQRKDDEANLRQDIRDAVEVAWLAGNPLNREGVKAKSKRKHSEVITCLETLLSERWLYEVFVPAKERLHPRKSSFFVNLTTEEHEAVLSGGGLPDAKLVIPDCWKKAPVSIMPDAGHGCTRIDVSGNE